MVFTKRERIIIAATVASVALLVVDVYVLTPVLGRREVVRAERERLLAELRQTHHLLERRKLLAPKWRGMLAGGMRGDPAEAESQILRSLRRWASEGGVSLSSLRPDRSTEKTDLPEITVHVTGTGSMYAVSRMLWHIEAAATPIKIKMLQLGSRKEGTDDLSMHLRVSTLYLPPEPAPDRSARAAGMPGGRR